MTGLELAGYLHAWITQVLITENGDSELLIINSHQNAPSPTTAYITVAYNATRSREGRASKGDVLDDGTRLLVSDWGLEIELRETNGDGDRLRMLIDSLDREDIYHTYFVNNGIAHYGSNDVTPIPRLNQESWVREAMVEMRLGIAEGTRETTSWIDTVDYTGTIGGLQE